MKAGPKTRLYSARNATNGSTCVARRADRTCRQRHEREHDSGRGIRQRVEWRHTKEETFQIARQQRRAADASQDTDDDLHGALPHDQRDDAAGAPPAPCEYRSRESDA